MEGSHRSSRLDQSGRRTFALITCVKVWMVVALPALYIHSDQKPVEARNFWHCCSFILPRRLHNALPRYVVAHDGKPAAALREKLAKPVKHREQQRRDQRVILRQQLGGIA